MSGQISGGFRVFDPDCVFCMRIAKKEFDATAVINVMRFEPLNPVVPGHMLFIPNTHRRDAAETPSVTGAVFQAASIYGKQQGKPFNLITSAGEEATQTVLHLHVHYVPRTAEDGLYLPWTTQKDESKLRIYCRKCLTDASILARFCVQCGEKF